VTEPSAGRLPRVEVCLDCGADVEVTIAVCAALISAVLAVVYLV
jgi:hypothetical protein